MNYEFKKNQIIEVDIHNMDYDKAKHYLERFLVSISSNIKEVVVIHGYRRGNILQNMVRKELKYKRIERRFLSLNQGRTSLILN